MQANKITIEMLNDLVQINNDRIKGYERALNELPGHHAGIQYMFKNCISESHLFNLELGSQMHALSKGREMAAESNGGGKLHRLWTDLKAAFMGLSTNNALHDCEMGEGAILNTYNEALQQKYLPAYIRQMLIRQKFILQDAHNDIKAFRNYAS